MSKPTEKIRILLIEENRILREGIAFLLKSQPDMKPIPLPSSADLIVRLSEVKPHILLANLRAQPIEWDILGLTRNEFPDVRIIGMGLSPSQPGVVEFAASGVSGFILKNASDKEFLDTIRSVAQGMKVLPAMLVAPFFSHLVEQAEIKEKPASVVTDGLTTRELEVLALIRQALSNKEIALRLNISTYTVKSHVHNILEKMALQSRMEIVRHSIARTERTNGNK